MSAESPDSAQRFPAFEPGGLLRDANLQSVLASLKLRRLLYRLRGHRMAAVAQRQIIDAGDGVRLVGFRSAVPASVSPRGRVVLLHGWEGCHDSAYLYAMACRLHSEGFEVIRLNLRDHGFTHHLNEEPFHSGRIDETIGAIRAIDQRFQPALPLFVVGFSLGGNFALRVGLHGPAAGLQPLQVAAISPAVNPRASLVALDSGKRLYHRYFMRKWDRSRRAKQAAFPHLYDFSEFDGLRSFEDITRRFAEEHTPYGNLDSYLDAYTLDAERLSAMQTPTLIITAEDDPVVPAADFRSLDNLPNIQLLLTRFGGHCGFIRNYRLDSWAEDVVSKLLIDVSARVGGS